MFRHNKHLTIHYYTIVGYDNFLADFHSTYITNMQANSISRIVTTRNKKTFIKLGGCSEYKGSSVYFLSIVRERNTWQTRALREGIISGVPLKQGIIGDPYYLLVVPASKLLLGFTTGLSGTTRFVASSVLQQFSRNHSSKIDLNRVSTNNTPVDIHKCISYNSLRFKINLSLVEDYANNIPGFLQGFFSPALREYNAELPLSFDVSDESNFPISKLNETIEFLFDNDACSALTLQGLNENGEVKNLDFCSAYAKYSTTVELKNKFVPELIAEKTLLNALANFNLNLLST